jgi:hypothetical protein
MKLRPAVSLCTEGEVLEPVARRLLTLRANFFDCMGTLPEPFGSTIKDHYVERLVRSEDRHMLGEYAPALLAQLLDIPEDPSDGITVQWLALYECSLLFDDVVDNAGSRRAEWALCAQFLYDYCLFGWEPYFEQYPGLRTKFGEYHAQAIAAALFEIQQSEHWCVRNPVDALPEMQAAMGRKAALVKFCGAVLSLQFKRRLLDSVEEEGIDSLCAGIQLLDDLTDSVEDNKSGHDNYVVRLALGRLLGRDGIWPTVAYLRSDELTAILVLSNVWSEIVRSVEGFLRKGLSALSGGAETMAVRYLNSISANCRDTAQTIECLLLADTSVIARMRLSLCASPDVFLALVESEPYRSTWRQIVAAVRGLATASN